MLSYIKDIEDIKNEFMPWVLENGGASEIIYDNGAFRNTIVEFEKEIGKLTPEFTRDDVVTYLRSRAKLSSATIRFFYDKCKTWVAYCNATGCYNKVLTEDEILQTFMYTVSVYDYKDILEEQPYVRSESELYSFLREYINETGRYLVALTVLLGWYEVTANEVCQLKYIDCNRETGELKFENKTLCLQPGFERDLLLKAMDQTVMYSSDGRRMELYGDVYILRGMVKKYTNQPFFYSAIHKNYMKHFSDVLGINLTFKQVAMSGKFYRLYQEELSGKSIIYDEKGNKRNHDLLTTYRAYKEYVQSGRNIRNN